MPGSIGRILGVFFGMLLKEIDELSGPLWFDLPGPDFVLAFAPNAVL
jgi:hypothetical protein